MSSTQKMQNNKTQKSSEMQNKSSEMQNKTQKSSEMPQQKQKEEYIIKGYWNVDNSTMYGVLPPYPSVVDYSPVYQDYSGVQRPFATGMPGVISMDPSPIVSREYSQTVVPSEVPTDRFTIYRIDSREPYASEFLVTKYGNLETRLGTSLGLK
jgi:hypothetical protein